MLYGTFAFELFKILLRIFTRIYLLISMENIFYNVHIYLLKQLFISSCYAGNVKCMFTLLNVGYTIALPFTNTNTNCIWLISVLYFLPIPYCPFFLFHNFMAILAEQWWQVLFFFYLYNSLYFPKSVAIFAQMKKK